MNTDKLSRRRLLASVPAMAAATVPVAATALPGLATAVPEHLDGQQVRGLAEMLDRLEKLPKDDANAVLKAVTEVLECGMNNHAHDAELMALKPQFDEVFEDWWSREEDSKLDKANRRYPSRTDAEIDEWADRINRTVSDILSHRPITREGLALQCRALIMDGFNVWDDYTARFIRNIVLFFGWQLPDMLMDELLTKDWPDEDEEEGEGEA